MNVPPLYEGTLLFVLACFILTCLLIGLPFFVWFLRSDLS